jgi:hypothetical protein
MELFMRKYVGWMPVLLVLAAPACLEGEATEGSGQEPDLRLEEDDEGSPPRNQAACLAYAESFNALECVPDEAHLSSDYCPADLDSGCDITEWYECLADKHTCEEDESGSYLSTEGYADCDDFATCG